MGKSLQQDCNLLLTVKSKTANKLFPSARMDIKGTIFWEGIEESGAIIDHWPTSLPSRSVSQKSGKSQSCVSPLLERAPRGPKGNWHATSTQL